MTPAAFLVLLATFLPITGLCLVGPRLRTILLVVAILPALGVWLSFMTGTELFQLAGAAVAILLALGFALTESRLPREQRRLACIGSVLLLGLLAWPALRTALAILDRPSDYLNCDSPSACRIELHPLITFVLSYWSILISAIFGSFGELLLILALLQRRIRMAPS
ncbi:hypothetical protein [Hypericibacter sp.]|uniref:hypothetical protein n=1 Tax=Hypericibacter sp. TaxID=2705401 RepID=UPI003D6C9F4D